MNCYSNSVRRKDKFYKQGAYSTFRVYAEASGYIRGRVRFLNRDVEGTVMVAGITGSSLQCSNFDTIRIIGQA